MGSSAEGEENRVVACLTDTGWVSVNKSGTLALECIINLSLLRSVNIV